MSTNQTRSALAVGDCLPDLYLTSASGGRSVSLRRQGRVASVVVLLHGADCDGCRSYLTELAGVGDSLREWDGRVVPVVPEDLEAASRLGREIESPFGILADPERQATEACGITDAAVLIADQWGEVYHVAIAGNEHLFPSTPDVVEWLRFLAIQCPECEGEAW